MAKRTFYDEHPFDLVQGYSPGELPEVISPLLLKVIDDLPRGACAFDVGCGAGRVTAYLASKGIRCVGFDMSHVSACLMMSRSRRPGVVADNLCLPIRDEQADLVISDGVVHHTEDPFGAFAENCRILKTGGLMYLAVYKPNGRYAFLYRYPGRLIRWALRYPAGRLLVHVLLLSLYYLVHLEKSKGKRTWGGARNLFYDYFASPRVNFLSLQIIQDWCENLKLRILSFCSNSSQNTHSFLLQKQCRGKKPAESSPRATTGTGGPSGLRKHSLYSFSWYLVNGFAVVSLCTLAFGLIWDYSERRYLKGFADAVVPASGSPEQKVESILGWMQSGPTRRTSPSASGILADREPEQTLNYSALLRACGSATNAFINLATSAGLRARRLLLLGEDDRTKHVVAEVWLGDRWVVVDPAYRTLLRDREGRFLTKEELRDASVLREATRGIPGYDSSYTFERTASIRLARVPYLGPLVGNILERILPEWEDMLNWGFVVQRRSLTFTYFASLVFFLSIVLRFGLGWYRRKRLGILRVPLQENMSPTGATLPESAR